MVSIRAAIETDIPALVQLWHEKTLLQADRRLQPVPGARDAWSTEARSWLSDPRCAFFVAERDSSVIGYIVGWVQPIPAVTLPRIGLITEIAVDTHGYHGGVGRLLVEALRAWFREQRIDQLAVWSPRFDAVGQAFWRSLGAAEWVDVLWIKS